LFYYQKAYAGKIYRDVYSLDLDFSGKTVSEAKEILSTYQDSLLAKEIVIKNEEKETKVTLSETGINIDANDIVDQLFKIGRSGNFLNDLFESSKTLVSKNLVTPAFRVNRAKFENFTAITAGQLNLDPVNASLSIDNGTVVVNEEKNGRTINIDDLRNQIENILISQPGVLPMIKPTVSLVRAEIGSANFVLAKKDAENILARQLTLKYEDKVFQPTRNEVGKWIIFLDNNGQSYVSLSDSQIKNYLTGVAKNIEIASVDRKINAPDNAVLEEGKEGKSLNYDKAMSDIKTNLTAPNSQEILLEMVTIPVKDIRVFPSEGLVLGRFEGKYIDIDLKEQKLCRVESTQLLDCYQISSGKASMPTPTGTFNIQFKNDRQWSKKYGLWMPYWEQISGDYGIHELPEWPNGYKEGEAHLGTPVSHGCVRLGVGAAKTVYDWTELGTTVYIHK